MYNFLIKYTKFADKLAKISGNLYWLVIPIMFIMLFEVIARYVFNSPTIWAWDINPQIVCTYAVLTGGYTAFMGGHIRSDLFYAKWSRKRKALVDVLTSILSLAFFIMGLIACWKFAVKAIVGNEHKYTLLQTPLAPIRIIITMGVLLFLIQVISDLIKNFFIVINSSKNGDSNG